MLNTSSHALESHGDATDNFGWNNERDLNKERISLCAANVVHRNKEGRERLKDRA